MVENLNDHSLGHINDDDLERPLSCFKGKALAFWYARSLCANFNLFKHDFERSSILCIGVSETWLTKLTPDCHIELKGF